MTEEDAMDEGFLQKMVGRHGSLRFALFSFQNVWDFLLSKKDRDKYGWNANPYVFVYEFERVEEI